MNSFIIALDIHNHQTVTQTHVAYVLVMPLVKIRQANVIMPTTDVAYYYDVPHSSKKKMFGHSNGTQAQRRERTLVVGHAYCGIV